MSILKLRKPMLSIAASATAVFFALQAQCALVDVDGNAAIDETALGDIDMAQSTLGDLKEEIAPNYETVSNKAMNAVNEALAIATNSVPVIDLISPYGIASSTSNAVELMVFSGILVTNRFVMVYDSSAANPNNWTWALYSGESKDTIENGTVEEFDPLADATVAIALGSTAAEIYETDRIVFETGKSSKTASGIVRAKDLTTVVYDSDTDWMSMYHNNQTARFYPNTNQVAKMIAASTLTNVSQLANDAQYVTKDVTNGLASASSIPTNVSQLQNDSGFATTSQVDMVVSNLNYDISINTNFVRRSDNNFNLGLGNIIGGRSLIMGDNSSVGVYAFSQGFNNTIGSHSVTFGHHNTLNAGGDSTMQYAFGFGNRSSGKGTFTMGIGSGANENGVASYALGTMAVSTNAGAFVWNWYPTDYDSVEADQIFDLFPKYFSHGDGTYNINPIGGLRGFWIGETNLADHIAQSVRGPITSATNAVTDDIKAFVTNSTIVGYTEWRYTGNTSPNAVYSITMTASASGGYDFTLNDTVSVTELGTVTTNILNPTMLVYENAGITASRDEIRRNKNGFAYNSDVQALRIEMTNEVQTLRTDVENMDTSYFRFDGLTNVNQSVQYIVPASGQTTLEIKIPESGITKDWVIYVNTNDQQPLTLVLPPANYWVTDETVTNDITTATALYFSQVTDNTFSLGRKEFVPVTVQNTTLLSIPARKPKIRKMSSTSTIKK